MTYTDPFDNREAGWASDTRSKGGASLSLKKEEFYPSLQPIQVEISMLGTDPIK